MKSFNHSEFEHERRAFANLYKLLPESECYELYPSLYITDRSRRIKHECDALFISKSFAAVIELKDWLGDIEVTPNSWLRFGKPTRNPHEVNLPKAKVFRSLMEQVLPAIRLPFVQSIVVLTSDKATVTGEDSAFEIVREIEHTSRIGDHLTFFGVEELAKYLCQRVARDQRNSREVLTAQTFKKLRAVWDSNFEVGCLRANYADQIPGFKIKQEIEHNDRYVGYVAEANPQRGDSLYRLRVFGVAAESESDQARQFRSLDALEALPPHPNIKRVYRHPNEKGLVVEVCQWGDVSTLDQILETNDNISVNFAVRIIREVARALCHIHESDAGLIHRNVVPRSILVGRDDHIELTDFDFAFDPSADYTVMSCSFSEYEKRYFAPEALIGSADYASDIYSLGQTFIELLERSEDHIDEKLEHLCKRMVEHELSKRLSARELVNFLNDWLGECPENGEELLINDEIQLPEIGHTHDTWLLKERLGSGGTCEVFLGDSLGDLAALKIFRADVPRDKCLTERDFLRVSNSNFIAKFRGFLQWNGIYWCIVTEYVQGVTLKALISEGDRPDAHTFMTVASQIIQALIDLHEPRSIDYKGEECNLIITHNDVTPGNIIFNPEFR